MAETRKLENWLKSFQEYVEDTEAPRIYWLWGGIFTICAALQRRVWVNYGMENIYPNLYLLIVAPPGERKGGPPTQAKKLLEAIDVPVAVDSSSKRALTEELVATSMKEQYVLDGKTHSMATLAVISKELSSLLAVDPKGIIEVLTDLYDSHDIWKYKTSGKGEDFLYNVCVSEFVVSTPTWFMNNLPIEAIGGGYTARHIILSSGERYKSVDWPPIPPKRLWEKLVHDLRRMNNLVGEFKVGPEARAVFKTWYDKIVPRMHEIRDERVHGFMNRMHVTALKVAMALHVSEHTDLILTTNDIGRAIDLVDATIEMASTALGGHGRSKSGPDVDLIMKQIRMSGRTTEKELLAANWRHMNKTELKEVLDTIEGMGRISIVHNETGMHITWRKE